MTNPPSDDILAPVSAELERSYLAHRPALMNFLARLGAGDAAEDILHEMWMRLPKEGAPIHSPKHYLFRMANSVLIDWERSKKSRQKRDGVWADVAGPTFADRSEFPAADRVLEARQTAARAFQVLAEQGPRVARIFTRHRVDGLTQQQVAAELGVSVGTVEGDLRRAYSALMRMRERDDEV